ncbi:MAG: hypothetical protein HJJLKODD_01199 [Phycisphaerae bacterium]|nr:hypothetical protein [Phycisphaerae bacterium]
MSDERKKMRLALNRETVRLLNDQQLHRAGGAAFSGTTLTTGPISIVISVTVCQSITLCVPQTISACFPQSITVCQTGSCSIVSIITPSVPSSVRPMPETESIPPYWIDGGSNV